MIPAVLGAATLAGALLAAAPAGAVRPIARPIASAAVPSKLTRVQFYGGYYYDDRYVAPPFVGFWDYDWVTDGWAPYDYGYGRYGYGGYGWGGFGPGWGGYGGFGPGWGGGGRSAYCAWRFRSYNPYTGTYLGWDGWVHFCG
jgi:hypothetical protein